MLNTLRLLFPHSTRQLSLRVWRVRSARQTSFFRNNTDARKPCDHLHRFSTTRALKVACRTRWTTSWTTVYMIAIGALCVKRSARREMVRPGEDPITELDHAGHQKKSQIMQYARCSRLFTQRLYGTVKNECVFIVKVLYLRSLGKAVTTQAYFLTYIERLASPGVGASIKKTKKKHLKSPFYQLAHRAHFRNAVKCGFLEA